MRKILGSLTMVVISAVTSLGQIITRVDVVTGESLGSPVGHLYESRPSINSNLAGRGLSLWFVSDGGSAGLGLPDSTGLLPASVPESFVTSILSGNGEDSLLFEALTPGTLLGSHPGKFQISGRAYPESEIGKPVYALLWSDSSPGDPLDTFGILELSLQNGRIRAPEEGQAGNYLFRINGDVFADQYVIAAVPEPVAGLAVASMLCFSAVVLGQTRRHRKRDSGSVSALPSA